MYDCVNVEVRESLPDLLNGRLDEAARARVEAHLLGCADCAAELETLRAVRSAFGAGGSGAAGIDIAGIVAALPRLAEPGAANQGDGSRAPAVRPMRRWVDWRVAAALTMITVGGLSVAVANRTAREPDPHVIGVDTPAVPAAPSAVSPSAPAGSTEASAPPAAAHPALTFGGGVRDLEADEIEALLAALDEIDSAPVMPAAEPDRGPLIPIDGEAR